MPPVPPQENLSVHAHALFCDCLLHHRTSGRLVCARRSVPRTNYPPKDASLSSECFFSISQLRFFYFFMYIPPVVHRYGFVHAVLRYTDIVAMRRSTRMVLRLRRCIAMSTPPPPGISITRIALLSEAFDDSLLPRFHVLQGVSEYYFQQKVYFLCVSR